MNAGKVSAPTPFTKSSLTNLAAAHGIRIEAAPGANWDAFLSEIPTLVGRANSAGITYQSFPAAGAAKQVSMHDALVAWWLNKKPFGMDEAEFLERPASYCSGAAKPLAIAVAELHQSSVRHELLSREAQEKIEAMVIAWWANLKPYGMPFFTFVARGDQDFAGADKALARLAADAVHAAVDDTREAIVAEIVGFTEAACVGVNAVPALAAWIQQALLESNGGPTAGLPRAVVLEKALWLVRRSQGRQDDMPKVLSELSSL